MMKITFMLLALNTIALSQKLISIGIDPAENLLPLFLKYKGVTSNLLMNFKSEKEKNISVMIGYSNFFNSNEISEKSPGYSNLSQRNRGVFLSIGTKNKKKWGYFGTLSIYSQTDDLLYYDNDFDQIDKTIQRTDGMFAIGASLYKDWIVRISKKIILTPRGKFSFFIGKNSDYSSFKSYLPGAGILFNGGPVGLSFSCPIIYKISKEY